MPRRELAPRRRRPARRRVAGHRAGVAEAEVDVLVAVDVGEVRALPPRRRTAGTARPTCIIHDIGTPPASECRAPARAAAPSAGGAVAEALELGRGERREPVAVDGDGTVLAHACDARRQRPPGSPSLAEVPGASAPNPLR